jgi:hypothetical protein
MVRSLSLEFLGTAPKRAVVRLPGRADHHNHVAGPLAWA